eukprot:6117830-Prymnesium_polylepis.1
MRHVCVLTGYEDEGRERVCACVSSVVVAPLRRDGRVRVAELVINSQRMCLACVRAAPCASVCRVRRSDGSERAVGVSGQATGSAGL